MSCTAQPRPQYDETFMTELPWLTRPEILAHHGLTEDDARLTEGDLMARFTRVVEQEGTVWALLGMPARYVVVPWP